MQSTPWKYRFREHRGNHVNSKHEKAYNADQQGSAKLYIHADGGRDTATLLSQEETNKTMAFILETYAANIKNSRDKLIEIINTEYATILEEIEKLKV